MSDSDKAFAGSIPELYDTLLVPLIFEAYALDLAQRVAAASPGSVLETAAGSGVVARALTPLLGRDARYTVTDLNQPMLDRAMGRQPAEPRLSWLQADALTLPFPDASFDMVCCQFGVMFFPNKPQGYREAFRTLRNDGQFIFNVWDRIEDNEFAHSITETVARLFPDDPPLFITRTPHGYHDIAAITDQLRAAGFSTVTAHTLTERSIATRRTVSRWLIVRGRRSGPSLRRAIPVSWTPSPMPLRVILQSVSVPDQFRARFRRMFSSPKSDLSQDRCLCSGRSPV